MTFRTTVHQIRQRRGRCEGFVQSSIHGTRLRPYIFCCFSFVELASHKFPELKQALSFLGRLNLGRVWQLLNRFRECATSA